MTALAATSTTARAQLVYFGTYTKSPASQGIYVARLDPATGQLTEPTLAATAFNPTFLAQHPSQPILYAVGNSAAPYATEPDAKAPPSTGVVTAFTIDPVSGALTQRNQVPDLASGGTYLSVTPDGRGVLTVHYTGGNITGYGLHADGALGARSVNITHTQTGLHPQQSAPHPHCIAIAPGGRFAFVADLAADRVFSYRLSHAADHAPELSPNTPDSLALPPAAGPRHIAFDRNARHAYIINELAATITACAYDAATGTLREIQTISTVPNGFTGRRWAAEIAIHPNGNTLYASNRADAESIAAYAIDQATGKLTLLQFTTGLAHPRHFAIDPSGHWLLCANHDNNTIVVFRIDPTDGTLSAPVSTITVPTPVCVRFYNDSPFAQTAPKL